MNEKLKENEVLILEAMLSGTIVQDYLWGENSLNKKKFIDKKDVWISVFQKRIDKIKEIDFTHPSYKVELRKRILQQACLSIQALKTLDNNLEFPKLEP
jgi:hypothetical protein